MYDEDSTLCRSSRQGLRLDLGDPKKSAKMDSGKAFLTNRDVGMLELTSPELERLILDPTNDRFLGGGGGGTNSFVRGVQESQRPFDSSLDHYQRNLPQAAEDAVVSSSDEDYDTESSQATYTTLVAPRSKSETGFSGESYFSIVDSKPVSRSTAGVHSTPLSLLPTAVHPGVSYLPFGTFQSLPTRLKEEPMQMVPCLDGSPSSSLPSPINMDDQDRAKQERKRERNRLAARKCRTRKLEQIMHLEERVKELKEQNRSLGDTATALRAMMHALQAQISQHISCGCPITMTNNTTMMNSSSFAMQ